MKDAETIATETLCESPAYDYESQQWHDGGTDEAIAAHRTNARSTLRALAMPGYAATIEEPELQAAICRHIVS